MQALFSVYTLVVFEISVWQYDQRYVQCKCIMLFMYRVMFSYLQMYMEYIRSLPINNTPEIFGLHDNANITFAQNDTNALLEALLLLQPKSSSAGGSSREEVSVKYSSMYTTQLHVHTCILLLAWFDAFDCELRVFKNL